MNNIEEYQNLFELLKQALMFYGEEDNYKVPVSSKGNYNVENELSLIKKDGGSQARFGLKKIQEIFDQNQKLLDDYNKIITETIKGIEDTPINLTDTWIH